MKTTTLPARDWRLGDIVIPVAGPPRSITLHRLDEAPGCAVVGFDGIHTDTRYVLTHTERIQRPT